jgi:hypothetical protein
MNSVPDKLSCHSKYHVLDRAMDPTSDVLVEAGKVASWTIIAAVREVVVTASLAA